MDHLYNRWFSLRLTPPFRWDFPASHVADDQMVIHSSGWWIFPIPPPDPATGWSHCQWAILHKIWENSWHIPRTSWPEIFRDINILPQERSTTFIWLVVYRYTYPSEKYEFVSWDDDIINWMGKSKSCSKTPTSYPFNKVQEDLPSGSLLHSYGKIQHFYWENSP